MKEFNFNPFDILKEKKKSKKKKGENKKKEWFAALAREMVDSKDTYLIRSFHERRHLI